MKSNVMVLCQAHLKHAADAVAQSPAGLDVWGMLQCLPTHIHHISGSACAREQVMLKIVLVVERTSLLPHRHG